MSTEQFKWIDGNFDKDDRRGFTVTLVNDCVDLAFSNSAVIGVVVDSIDPLNDPAWATIQLSGRAFVYKSAHVDPRWILLRSNCIDGFHGPMDEYLVR
jgi:hypothetical protein